MTTSNTRDVCIVGGGVAGLTASIFTARAGLDTLVVNTDEPILGRNAHLENVPGFPAGVDARLFLEMVRDQAERNGAALRDGRITRIDRADAGRFTISIEDGDAVRADYAICTSWSNVDYLTNLDGVGLTERGSKTYVDVEDDGSTGVDGLYAAGRIAETHHQTVVAAGSGASVALTVIDESDVPFYHDWVAPEGYFTGRGRDVPPGCEEIDDAERKRRVEESMDVMKSYFDESHPDEPTQHPSVADRD